jgi:PAS domain-containing protein
MERSRKAETGRRAGEPESRAGEDRFAAAFNSAGVMMLIVRAGDGTIVDVNRAFLARDRLRARGGHR